MELMAQHIADADYARAIYRPHVISVRAQWEEPDPPAQGPGLLHPTDGSFLLSRGARDTLLHGLQWGLTAKLDGPPVKRVDTVLDTHLVWIPEQETAAAKHVRERVMEGLLEIAYVTLQRLDFEKLLYGNAHVPEDEQGAEAFNREVRSKLTNVNGDIRNAATSALRLEKDLKRRFEAAGNSFTKTLEVCALYLEGTMGVDWFVADYFRPMDEYEGHNPRDFNPLEADLKTRAGHTVKFPIGLFGIDFDEAYKQQEQRMLEQKFAMEKHLKGNPHQHFGNRNLKPLMKQYPHLARLYGVEAT